MGRERVYDPRMAPNLCPSLPRDAQFVIAELRQNGLNNKQIDTIMHCALRAISTKGHAKPVYNMRAPAPLGLVITVSPSAIFNGLAAINKTNRGGFYNRLLLELENAVKEDPALFTKDLEEQPYYAEMLADFASPSAE